jgi:phosphohistidine phosphatase
MGRIVLLRHGKAQPPGPGPDRDRPLTAVGEEQAAAMGKHLAEQGLAPDRVVASPASRTLRTAHLAATAAGSRAPIVEDASLYEAEGRDVLAALERHTHPGTLWVVGHNPSLQDASGAPLGVACAAVLEADGAHLRLLDILEP